MKSQWQFVRRLGEPRAAMACPRGGVGGGPRPGGRARCGKSPAALPGPVAPPRASAHRPRRGPWVGRCHGKLSRAAAGGGPRGCSGGRAIGLPAAGGLGRGPIGFRWAAADRPPPGLARSAPAPGPQPCPRGPGGALRAKMEKILGRGLGRRLPGAGPPGRALLARFAPPQTGAGREPGGRGVGKGRRLAPTHRLWGKAWVGGWERFPPRAHGAAQLTRTLGAGEAKWMSWCGARRHARRGALGQDKLPWGGRACSSRRSQWKRAHMPRLARNRHGCLQFPPTA